MYILPLDVIYCAVMVDSNTKVPFINSPEEGAETDNMILNCNGCNRKCYFNLRIKGAWVSLLPSVYYSSCLDKDIKYIKKILNLIHTNPLTLSLC